MWFESVASKSLDPLLYLTNCNKMRPVSNINTTGKLVYDWHLVNSLSLFLNHMFFV